jgi:soluble lytic murein transglycosylase
MMRPLSRLLLLATLIVVSSVLADEARDLERDRLNFRYAYEAIRDGRMATYRRIATELTDYALYPYLEYRELRRNLGTSSDEEVEGFLERHPDLPLSFYLREAWLDLLARRGRWEKFLELYEGGSDTRMECLAIRARIARGGDEALLDDIQALWLTGRSQPKECDPAFDLLYASDRITTELVWERIALAMDRGNQRLARFLGKRLNAQDQDWLELWILAHRRPEAGLEDPRLHKDIERARIIVRHAIERLAGTDPERAHTLWHRVDGHYSFSPEELFETDREIALQAAYAHLPEAQTWLAELALKDATGGIGIWWVRSALRNQDWPALLTAIESLSAAERGEDRWQYWLARALEQTGQNDRAQTIFARLAENSNYYGFLATDRLDRPYRLVSEAIVSDEEREKAHALLEIPGILRARELYAANMIPEARREWYLAISLLSDEEIRLAAILADEWGWHDSAIRAVAEVEHWTDFDLRFPTPYREQVLSNAEAQRLDPAWVYGVMRRESAFMEDARSGKGALGLMQVMPYTARSVARKLGLRRPNQYEILEVDRNITLGSAYLRQILDRFDGNQVLATAAYNAGPNAVRRWVPESKEKMPADLWVETVPYRETRGYVAAVMAYTTIFDWKLDEDITPLKDRMIDIPGTEQNGE